MSREAPETGHQQKQEHKLAGSSGSGGDMDLQLLPYLQKVMEGPFAKEGEDKEEEEDSNVPPELQERVKASMDFLQRLTQEALSQEPDEEEEQPN